MFLRKPNVQKLRKKRDVKGLGKALYWENGDGIVNNTVLALHELERMDAVEIFIETADYPNSFDLCDALKEIGVPAIGSMLALIKKGSNYVDELAAIGPLSVDPLLTVLNDNLKRFEIPADEIDDTERIILSVIEALGKLRVPGAVSNLIPLLEIIDEKIINASIDALGKIRNSSAIAALISKFTDVILNPTEVSIEAQIKVEEIGRAAIPQLKKAIKSTNREISKTSKMVLDTIEEELQRKKKGENESTSFKFYKNAARLISNVRKENIMHNFNSTE